MLVIKLKAPEASVSYNKVGRLISTPVPYTPEKIKATGLDLEIRGYTCEDVFFATELTSNTRSFSRQEQYSLLKQLGFKLLPIQVNEEDKTTENVMIKTAQRYAKYGAYWWSENNQKEVELPVLNTIISIDWKLDEARRLVKVLTTESGEFDVIDHSCPEYYQPGSVVKVKDGKVYPYKGTTIVVNTPGYCPLCSNPLARLQVSSDTPLIFKCKSPFCMKMLRTTEEKLPEVVEETSEETFRGQAANQINEVKIPEEPHEFNLTEPEVSAAVEKVQDVISDSIPLYISYDVNSLPESIHAKLLKPDSISEEDNPAGILVKSTRSISKRSRKLREETGLPFIYLDELKGEK